MRKGRFLKDDILVVVLAGGEGRRLMPLTATRTKPAVPIGGKFRLIDIPLSNAANSGLHRVLVLTQGKDKSLNRHLKDTWYSDRHRGGFVDIITPQGVGESYLGDADAVRQICKDIRALRPRYVLVVPGDHLLKMDYFRFVMHMLDMGAHAAISVLPRPMEHAGQLGSLEVDGEGCIRQIREKDPQTPLAFTREDGQTLFWASMGIYAFQTQVLLELLKQEGVLFGRDLLPALLGQYRVAAYPYEEQNVVYDEGWVHVNGFQVPEMDVSSDSSYWRDVGTIGEYFQANMDLTGISPIFNLYGRRWPFLTFREDLGPAKIIRTVGGGGMIESAVVGESSFLSNVGGREIVISPQVYVDRSDLNRVIVFGRSTRQRCRIFNTIVEKDVQLMDMEVGFSEEMDRANGIFVDPDSGIRVVPKGYDHAQRFVTPQPLFDAGLENQDTQLEPPYRLV